MFYCHTVGLHSAEFSITCRMKHTPNDIDINYKANGNFASLRLLKSTKKARIDCSLAVFHTGPPSNSPQQIALLSRPIFLSYSWFWDRLFRQITQMMGSRTHHKHRNVCPNKHTPKYTSRRGSNVIVRIQYQNSLQQAILYNTGWNLYSTSGKLKVWGIKYNKRQLVMYKIL